MANPFLAESERENTRISTPRVFHRGREPRKPPTGRVEQDLYCAGRYLSIGRYPIAGSIATHRSGHFAWYLERLFGCKYHRRFTFEFSNITARGPCALPGLERWGSASRAFLGGVRCVGYLEIIELLEVSGVIRRRDAHFLVEVVDVERGFCRYAGECVYGPSGL
ncbi:hypothetical protein FRC0332_00618 [Corynebacterium diphtheriae]|nr:hypothetical protein FRC0332_00618 [Corynebacterium diphtheriae]